ncbi:MAG: DUF2811 domain-containing protein [Leptolyngbya sp. SIO1D8]|nr:DUF2811 domain-containing protein [Leptolyngbya sp. SIO1D8]
MIAVEIEISQALMDAIQLYLEQHPEDLSQVFVAAASLYLQRDSEEVT